jgi:hypothetical protein
LFCIAKSGRWTISALRKASLSFDVALFAEAYQLLSSAPAVALSHSETAQLAGGKVDRPLLTVKVSPPFRI